MGYNCKFPVNCEKKGWKFLCLYFLLINLTKGKDFLFDCKTYQ